MGPFSEPMRSRAHPRNDYYSILHPFSELSMYSRPVVDLRRLFRKPFFFISGGIAIWVGGVQ